MRAIRGPDQCARSGDWNYPPTNYFKNLAMILFMGLNLAGGLHPLIE